MTTLSTALPAATAPAPSAPLGTARPLPPLPAWARDPARPLIERLAARISAGLDEIAVFPSVEAATQAVAAALVATRRVVLVTPANAPIASSTISSAGSVREAGWEPRDLSIDGLVSAARDAQAVVLSSPVRGADGVLRALRPRDLLRLRSRATRPAIVLDLTDEDLAVEPLTQAALLLPGTVAIRAFGRFWREAGASGLAGVAFVVGPREFIDLVGRDALSAERAEAASRDLDSERIERTACAAARACRAAP